ncbi:MAG: zinc-binding dehydrogenase [Rhodoferax sp.]
MAPTPLPLPTCEGKVRHGEIMREVTRLAESGPLKPRVDSRHFDLNSVGDTHAQVEKQQVNGKIVINIAG